MMGELLLSAVVPVAHAASPSQLSVEKPGYGVVTASGGSVVFRESNTSSQSLTTIPYSDYIMIVGEQGNFYRVQYTSFSKSYGYVLKTDIYFENEDYYLVVVTDHSNLNMRSGPGTNYDIVTSIPNGTSFAYVLDSYGDWCSAVYGNVYGFVSMDYVQKKTFD